MKIDLLPLSQISDALASGAVSPEALLEASLARIRAIDGRLHAFLRLTTDEAHAAAKASAQRRSSRKPLGPLDGVPIALKDIFCMEGVETTCGSRILEGYVPPYDARGTCPERRAVPRVAARPRLPRAWSPARSAPIPEGPSGSPRRSWGASG